MAHFADRLIEAIRRKRTPVVVGLDPRPELLPGTICARHGLGPTAAPAAWARGVEEFCCRVLEIVAPRVPAVKVQSAFFEMHGAAGMAAMGAVLRKAARLDVIAILDAKRADIGSTSEAYAQAAFGHPAHPGGADALTVNPYLGRDSLEPFLKYARSGGRGLFVLVRTSNPGARDLQELSVSEPGTGGTGGAGARSVYDRVAAWVSEWSAGTRGAEGYGAVGAVVGGTAGAQVARLRAAMPGTLLLVPGYGAQGATARDVAPAFDSAGLGALISSSRGVLFPDTTLVRQPPDRADAWEAEIDAALERMIHDVAEHTPAGQLRGQR